MQTFLPSPSFVSSATALDSRRLGKQIMECRQILAALQAGPGAPWYGHPAVQMWAGALTVLREYADACAMVWRQRTGRQHRSALPLDTGMPLLDSPAWLCHEPYHRGQRGHLYRKDQVHYAAFADDADAPLLYPARVGESWVYVERVAPGRFRLGAGPVCGSVRAAVERGGQR